MDEGYSRDLETFNFTLVLYIKKRGPAFDVPEDKSTNTNTNTNIKEILATKVKPAASCERSECIRIIAQRGTGGSLLRSYLD